MSSIITTTFHSSIGDLLLGVYNNKLCCCDWAYRKMRPQIDKRIMQFCNADFVTGEHPIITDTICQLTEYLEGNRSQFEIPLLLCGTAFQQSVWQSLQEIPYGATMSYSSLSRKRNNPKSIRAVAGANGANAISILIPCHRIIGSNGSLVGYAGGLQIKKRLLRLEGVDLSNGQQTLF